MGSLYPSNEDIDLCSESFPIEEVAKTVPMTDDPNLPVWTFRMWLLGTLSCAGLAFLNQFFFFRTQPLIISSLTAQIAVLPIGRFMAYYLPRGNFLNPGPFNIKEHVLITIFANAGSAFGSGSAYAIDIVAIVKAFYKRSMSFVPSILVIITTQVLGYGWAGIYRKFLVEAAEMWWPSTLVSVSLFRTLHEPDPEPEAEAKDWNPMNLRFNLNFTRLKFFYVVATLSFVYYLFPGFLFNVLSCMSIVCWIWPHSVTAQQLGSGLYGLGLGAIGLDWATASSYLSSPLATPLFAIINIFIGFIIFMYVITPSFYWSNIFHAKNFPIVTSDLFTYNGSVYDVSSILNNKDISLNHTLFRLYGNVHMSAFFAVTYGVGFAALTATVVHVLLWNGPEIWKRTRSLKKAKSDVYMRLMSVYPQVPLWWFLSLGLGMLILSLITCEVWKEQLQLPWWGVLFGASFAAILTLPIGVIAATTNQVPGLNIVTEFIMGYLLPGKPIGVMMFKVYGYISMAQAISFLQDFKLGHYMKIPPRSMFIVQVIGTILAGITNLLLAWYQLGNIENICDMSKLPEGSPWTCPISRVFFNSSIIWGLIGPKRMFGSLGEYSSVNWFWLIGALAPLPFWLLSKYFPKMKWLGYIHMPILIGATGIMPPATAVNFTTWFLFGVVFNYFVFRYHKVWWMRYNYVLSAALDVGVAFMAVFLFFALQNNDVSVNWWGNRVDNCPYASCPIAHGVNFGTPLSSTNPNQVCPVF